LRLGRGYFEGSNLETAAECLARAIAESSLEQLFVENQMRSVLSRTTLVRNLDFAFSTIGDDELSLKINRKWKPILNANIPLGLWPRILEKAHASPGTSHGQEGILFVLLREKPDLVPHKLFRKRKRAGYEYVC
jgi:hypothetical protein